AVDEILWEHGAMARASVELRPGRGHTLRLTWSPSFTTRTGRDRLHTGARDPLSAERDLLRLVTGLEHELVALDERVQSVVFAKDYVMLTSSEEVLPGGVFQPLERAVRRAGGGAAVRLRLGGDVWLKASYELATRLPRADELFGNGVIIQPSLTLEPETSHNG